ncbi:MAG: GNAT family N-acetyltransferase [bacterium]|nr:GNAT family N-acetyltransferase [bacterium]
MIRYRRIEMDSEFYRGERELRNHILLRPIGIPDYGWEMHDSDSYHFVALDGNYIAGCALLYPLPDCLTDVQLMQMAVTGSLQGEGVGRGLVDEIIAFARSQGYKRLICHSREEAVGFYRKLGFKQFGEPFIEVDICHYHMKLNLTEKEQRNEEGC